MLVKQSVHALRVRQGSLISRWIYKTLRHCEPRHAPIGRNPAIEEPTRCARLRIKQQRRPLAPLQHRGGPISKNDLVVVQSATIMSHPVDPLVARACRVQCIARFVPDCSVSREGVEAVVYELRATAVMVPAPENTHNLEPEIRLWLLL